MVNRKVFAAAVLAAGCVAAGPVYAQQSDADWLAQCKEQRDSRFRHCEVRPVNIAWSGAVRVDASPNGGVQLKGADVAGVEGSARIQVEGRNEAEARAVAGQIAIDSSTGTLRASGPKSDHNQSWSVSFVLSAPRRTDVQLDTVNGPVAISGITGQIRATTKNGPLTAKELGGDVRIRVTNGPLNIVLGGTTWEGTGLDAETQNGPLKISVPEGYSAHLVSGTTNGPFRVGIPVPQQVESERPRRSIDTTIGGGGATIRAVTTNGPLSITRQ